jgi:hypothetical protein
MAEPGTTDEGDVSMTTTAKSRAFVISCCTTTFIAGGLVVGAASAHAVPLVPLAPPCTQWGFPNGGNGFKNNIGQSLLFQAAGKSVTQAPASWTGPSGTNGSGYLNGSINGSGLNFTWKGDGGPPNFKGGATITFVGTVNNDGSAGGTVSYSDGGPGSFTSNKPMTCVDAAPQQQQPQKPAEPQNPPPPQVYTNAITPAFDGQQNVFNVTLTNSSPLPATCNYEAVSLNPLVPSDTKRTFDVPANGKHTESFKGLKTGTQYKITIPCTDSSGKQSQQLGSVNQTVTW